MSRLTLVLASSYRSSIVSVERLLRLLPVSLVADYEIRRICYKSGESLLCELDAIGSNSLRDAMVVCDIGGFHSDPWNVRQLGLLGAGIAAHLVLAFPEVYFVFLGGGAILDAGVSKVDPVFADSVRSHHFVPWPEIMRLGTLINWHRQGFRTLFDATALRSHLKRGLIAAEARVGDDRGDFYTYLSVARMKLVAAVADDEHAFAFLNAYVMYRAGLRVWMLSSGREFRRILPESLADRNFGPKRLNLILTDWDLAFADCEAGSQSNAMIRATEVHADEPILLVTSFVGHPTIRAFISGMERTRAQEAHAASVRSVEKPFLGIFALRRQIAFLRLNLPEPSSAAASSGSASSGSASSDRHALPNARRLIVDRLLQRASSLARSQDTSPVDQVHRALLALEAKEILGGLSLTSYHEALAMQHQAEVGSEVACFGSAIAIDVRDRLADLYSETEAMLQKQKSHGPDLSFSSESRLMFLAHLSNRLRQTFSSYGQVAAAEQFLKAFAKLQNEIGPKAGVWPHIQNAIGRYADWATEYGTSVKKLVLVNAAVILIWAALYALVLLPAVYKAHVPTHHAIAYAFGHSLFTFLELQPGLSEVEGLMLGSTYAGFVLIYRSLVVLELVVAYLNLGLLIAILYRRLLRQAP